MHWLADNEVEKYNFLQKMLVRIMQYLRGAVIYFAAPSVVRSDTRSKGSSFSREGKEILSKKASQRMKGKSWKSNRKARNKL